MACLDDDTISNFVSGVLAPAQVASVNEHARGCERCRRLIGTLLASPARNDVALRATAATRAEPVAVAGAAAPHEPAPESDVQRLMRALGQRDADRLGQLLAGKYRLDRELGSGGMGVVYEALNTWTKRRVALKLLRPHFSKDAEMVRRFMREARAASRISHPNVVDILDLGQDGDGALFMVQEFLVGRTLRQRLDADKTLPEAEARAILLPIMDALAAAHSLGIVHRDVKPENIFLAERETTAPASEPREPGKETVPTLIDFGVAKRAAPDSLDPQTTGHPIGTPLYMPPEQLRAQDDLDGRADVWAIGVVLFEALAGRRPFDATNPSDVIAQVLMKRAPPLSSVAPGVSPSLASLVERALEADRERRFPSVQAMAEALRAAPIKLPRPQPRQRAGAPGRGSRHLVTIGVVLAALVALGVAVVMLLRQ
jgi:serine/threonine-protein kinase